MTRAASLGLVVLALAVIVSPAAAQKRRGGAGHESNHDQLPGGAARALRQAQLEAMKQHPHPFAWAAFVLTGAPR